MNNISLIPRGVFPAVFLFMRNFKFLFIAVLLFLIGCRAPAEKQPKNAGKYISLTPAITEILFALDLKEEIAAVTDYCNYPPQASQKTSVGTIMNPSMEKIAEINPEIIFAGKLTSEKTVETLKKRGFRVVIIKADSFYRLKEDIENIGGLTGRERNARLLTEKIDRDIAEITKIVGKRKRVKTFVEISHRPLMTAGGRSYLNEVIYLAGGINIGSDSSADYLNVNYEYIVKRRPEAIILLSELSSRDKKRMKNILSGIPAVKNGRVYIIKESDRDIFLRPGPRIAEAVKKLAQILHPQAEGL